MLLYKFLLRIHVQINKIYNRILVKVILANNDQNKWHDHVDYQIHNNVTITNLYILCSVSLKYIFFFAGDKIFFKSEKDETYIILQCNLILWRKIITPLHPKFSPKIPNITLVRKIAYSGKESKTGP